MIRAHKIRLHRRVKGSKNREKARRQVARLHYRITCMRDDVLHKLTTRLADCYGIVGIENLNLKGLLKNRKLARSFSDAALGKLLNLLTSKVEQRGGLFVTVDRIFLCQNHQCSYYQFPQDRDHNASLDILREAFRLVGLIDQVALGTGLDGA
jgi:putative transposase